MVWEAGTANGGFGDATPWLPVKAPQLERAVDTQNDTKDSVLNAYRQSIAYRKGSAALMAGRTEFVDLDEPVLAFHRIADGQTLTCIFNLSPKPVELTVEGQATCVGPMQAVNHSTGALNLGANGFVYLETVGDLPKLGMNS